MAFLTTTAALGTMLTEAEFRQVGFDTCQSPFGRGTARTTRIQSETCVSFMRASERPARAWHAGTRELETVPKPKDAK